jgi:DNA-binding transcriptional MocR family regulator
MQIDISNHPLTSANSKPAMAQLGRGSELPIYQAIADQLHDAINKGTLRAGDRMPSVRTLCSQFGVSPGTATQAFRVLEMRMLVEARPKSGYFVRHASLQLSAHSLARLPVVDSVQLEAPVSGMPDTTRIVREFAELCGGPYVTPFAAATPDRRLLPEAKIQSLIATINRRRGFNASYPSHIGSLELRNQIARCVLTNGVQISADDIVATEGCMEALSIALRSVAKPGDTIAVESPTYFSLLQSLESLGMNVLEIPTHPREGISIEALELATRERGRVQAIVVMPNFQNPLGSLMSDERKQQLLALAIERDIPIIEDDVYGDLHHEMPRPWPIKAWDRDGRVLLCSSFSKTIAPSLRVGYLIAGRYRERAATIKYITSVASTSLQQDVVAAFISDGGYQHHLRKLRATLKANTARMISAMSEAFPEGCRVSMPRGGYILWVELPKTVDSRVLFRRAADKHIAIAPGAVFSLTGRYNNYLRMHSGAVWDDQLRDGLFQLGRLIRENV